MGNIVISNVSKNYDVQGRNRNALSDVSATILEGDVFCIMGSSGSGKSTLLKMLGGIEKLETGEINIFGKNMSDFSQGDYDEYRQKEIGYIFQDFNLLEGLTLKENILLPLALQNNKFTDIEKKYANVMKYVNISSFENNYPEKTSGGEQQRAAICRALIKSPKIILADEPTGNLDSQNIQIVLNTLLDINKLLKTTIVIVTHDIMVASYCSKVIFIENGRIHNTLHKTGSVADFYKIIEMESLKVKGLL